VIRVNRSIRIDDDEVRLRFIRSPGPGGQNVNKVATAVQLRFDVAGSASLPDDVRGRLMHIAAKRITQGGVLVIEAKRYRTQQRNRSDALERLVKLIRDAAKRPKKRRKTAPTAASKRRRLEQKRRRAEIKQLRRDVDRQQ